MLNHYFTNSSDLKENPKEISCWCGTKKLTFSTNSGVFSRNEIDDASLMLVRGIPELHGRVLDLGCGYGFIGIYAAVKNPGISLIQTDVNERAVELCRKNCEANGIDSSEVFLSDGFASINGKFDFILFNPPIHAGKDVVYRLAEESVEHLEGTGSVYIVIRKKHGASSLIDHMRESSDVNIIGRQKDIYLISCVRNK